MKFRNLALATAALSLATAPAIAQASFSRSNAPVEGESDVAGASGILIGVLAAAAVVGGILTAASNDDKQLPVSA